MMAKNQAWVITVDMGYGHQRAAYPLKDIAYERIITARRGSGENSGYSMRASQG
jgi:hypothetical protein